MLFETLINNDNNVSILISPLKGEIKNIYLHEKSIHIEDDNQLYIYRLPNSAIKFLNKKCKLLIVECQFKDNNNGYSIIKETLLQYVIQIKE
jgi:hypothetical protein